MKEKCYILVEISVKFVPKGPIDNYPALVQIMAWRPIGADPIHWSIYAALGEDELTHWDQVTHINGSELG